MADPATVQLDLLIRSFPTFKLKPCCVKLFHEAYRDGSVAPSIFGHLEMICAFNDGTSEAVRETKTKIREKKQDKSCASESNADNFKHEIIGDY